MRTTVRTTVLAIGLAILLVGVAGAAKLSTSQIFQKSKASVVLIVVYDGDNIPLGIGSGFYFAPNLIATNYHVVENGHHFKIRRIGTKTTVPARRVRSYSKGRDLAVLEVELPGKPLRLATANDPAPGVGENVVVIGNPRGFEGSVSTGIVSGLRNMSGIRFIQITAPISPGSSGGPVFRSDGTVIGISTFTYRKSQNLNFATSALAIQALARKKMVWSPGKPSKSRSTDATGIELSIYIKKHITSYETFSVRNRTQHVIRNIRALLVYKKTNGVPIHFRKIEVSDPIPPGLAIKRRIETFDREHQFYHDPPHYPGGVRFTVDFRVLSYEIVRSKHRDVIDDLLGE